MAGQNAWLKSGTVRNLLSETTPPTGVITGALLYKDSPHTTYQAVINGSGAITATIVIEVSDDGVNVLSTAAGTITLSGTTVVSDGFTTSSAPWKFHRARVSATTGTITSIFVYAGV